MFINNIIINQGTITLTLKKTSANILKLFKSFHSTSSNTYNCAENPFRET
ncbi:hypothetical protein PIROE2DRAFT_11247 [Piromyces sp. E2]|nr:hypothetical protein PIROE2DRAFT_11247 [Piromyces sp. E2]|eukprot:OUM62450.1 hypothetical protein PIROE2DRAFT_11247 [Piromyces sp. E2]